MNHRTPALPAEVLEKILDFCSQEKDTLHTLSFVSITCLVWARRQLFANITLVPPPNIQGSQIFRITAGNTRLAIPGVASVSLSARLLDIISLAEQKKSRLGSVAPFVRHLHVREGSRLSYSIATDSSLPPLLRALSNLLSFKLSRAGAMPIFWDRVPPNLQDVITNHLLSQPNLIEVRLSGLVFESLKQVSSLLRSCRQLRTLEIDHSGVQMDGQLEVEAVAIDKAALETLILGPFTPTLFMRFLLHPCCPVNVNTIRKLCLFVPSNFSDFVGILHASRCLDTLHLVLTSQLDMHKYSSSPPSEQVDLSKLPSLQNFRITFDVVQEVEDLLEWLAYVLRTAIDPLLSTRIKQLSIEFRLVVPGLSVDQLTDAFHGWRNIDAILSGIGRRDEKAQIHAFSNLKQVDLQFILVNPINLKLAPRFLHELVLDSPGLKERELLTIDAVDREAIYK